MVTSIIKQVNIQRLSVCSNIWDQSKQVQIWHSTSWLVNFWLITVVHVFRTYTCIYVYICRFLAFTHPNSVYTCVTSAHYSAQSTHLPLYMVNTFKYVIAKYKIKTVSRNCSFDKSIFHEGLEQKNTNYTQTDCIFNLPFIKLSM